MLLNHLPKFLYIRAVQKQAIAQGVKNKENKISVSGEWLGLASWMWIALFVLLITAFFSEGHHHPDEHYQLLEFANYYNGDATADQLPWEYREQMRPTFQVFIAAGVMKAVAFFNGSPFTVTLVLRLLSAALSFISLLLMFRAFGNRFQNKHAFQVLVFSACFLWFVVYHHVRFSSENWSGTLFLIGFAVYNLDFRNLVLKTGLVGVLFGLAFLCRYQLIFMVAGFALWLLIIEKVGWKVIGSGLLGFAAVVLFGFGLDTLFYGETTGTFYHYIYQNLVIGKAAEFGVEPFWWYLSDSFLKGIPPFSLVYLIAMGYYVVKQPKSSLTWIILPFFLVHCFIAHKETRFLVPLYFLMPLVLAGSVEIFFRGKGDDSRLQNLLVRLFIYLQIPVLIGVMVKPADSTVGLYKAIYAHAERVTVCGYEKSPYDGDPPNSMNFYKRPGFQYQQIQSVDEIHPGDEDKLFIGRKKEDFILAENRGWVEEYRSVPRWLENFNFNNWLDRTPQWRLYEVRE